MTNQVTVAAQAKNVNKLFAQLVDASNPSRVMGSPVELTALNMLIPEGRALLITSGEKKPFELPSSLGVVGKQEPGTQHPGALSKRDVLQNADSVLQTTENMTPLRTTEQEEPEQPSAAGRRASRIRRRN